MPDTKLIIWTNTTFTEEARKLLRDGIGSHQLVESKVLEKSILSAGSHDPGLDAADIAFGQPSPGQVISASKLKWVQLTTAGYDRFDTPEVRAAAAARGAKISNSSRVYCEPVAQHAMAMMMAQARQLPMAMANQAGARAWPIGAIRKASRLLAGQTVLILGYGTIARRLIELLGPFGLKFVASRRKPRGDEKGVQIVTTSQVDDVLGEADYVVNILPGGSETAGFMNADRFGRMKRSAVFYNVGRGSTVDQTALEAALRSGRIAAAWLDVMTPEPLPPEHALWTTPNCFVTPHTAGGHDLEFIALVEHFLANLRRFETGEELVDLVIGKQ
jgi:phosphoglycerate dehydrogenase-like enzyme